MSDDNRNEIKHKKLGHSKFSPIFFEVGGGMGKIERGIHWITSVIMIILSVVIIVGVLASFVNIPHLLKNILDFEANSLIDLLEFAATIIIAIELIYVIIAQNLESIVELLMIAITRELLIRQWHTWEILLGVCSVAALFAIRKFLLDKKDHNPNESD